ncbi:zinc finger domain-containing protein [Streptomyces sp. NPDC054904]
MTAPHTAQADDVERHPCPRCNAQPGSPCRSRSGAVAGTYHTGRFTKVPRLAKLLRVPAPADRGPGQPWRPGTPIPAPVAPEAPSADIRIGYARALHETCPIEAVSPCSASSPPSAVRQLVRPPGGFDRRSSPGVLLPAGRGPRSGRQSVR